MREVKIHMWLHAIEQRMRVTKDETARAKLRELYFEFVLRLRGDQ